MSISFRMPALPLGGAPITVVRWLIQPGELVAAGAPLLIALNDRVEVALPAPLGGLLEAHVVAEGGAVEAGAEIARFAGPAAPRQRVSPVARRVAADLRVALGELVGSGPGGRIHKGDVLRAARPPAPAQAPREFPGPPQVTSRAVGPIFPYALTAMEVDCTAVLCHLPTGAASGVTACVAHAAVAELLAHPLLNSAWREEYIVARRRVHLGVGQPGPCGCLRVRTVRDAQDLNLRGVARAIDRLARSDEHAPGDCTFAIIDGGLPGWSTAPVPWLGTAHLRLGAVQRCPRVVIADGVERVSSRPVATLALSYDARILDLHTADAFLLALKRRLERFDGR